ncbi:MAG: ECF transporter S component [Clostridiales bacterium]|nr:ECF transporter S component [Clostridiales bacterium]
MRENIKKMQMIEETQGTEQFQKVEHNRKRAVLIASILVVAIIIPCFICIGVTLLEDRKYYLISILIICASLIPFVIQIKQQQFSSRRLILIASMAAIATLGRIAFFFLPQFKPVLAVVIMAAILVGPMDGFLVGVLTGFISNFYYGQGPWTVWQMYCFGLVGFVAGLIFSHGKHNKFLVCLYGFVATFLLYGGVINFASVIMFYSYITPGALKASYIQGIPFDFIHAVATVIFLYFIYHSFTEKITRIQKKYKM